MNPELFENYLLFCEYRKGFSKSRKIDLSQASFLFPTTLLPLLAFMKEKHAEIIEPADSSVKSYVSTVLGKSLEDSSGKSYIPLVELPEDQTRCESLLRRIYEVSRTSQIFRSNENVFKFIIGELVDNIYDHSGFKHAWVMAQKYPAKGFVELGFLDNGISIPKCFINHGFGYTEKDHYKAIIDAMNGLSTKKGKGRGYGLNNSVRSFLALDGQILVVSGSGAVHLESEKIISYILTGEHKLKGTLISLRVQDSAKTIDLYDYLN